MGENIVFPILAQQYRKSLGTLSHYVHIGSPIVTDLGCVQGAL